MTVTQEDQENQDQVSPSSSTSSSPPPPYECPCCMRDLKGSARRCPSCGIALPRDWLDARLWSMFGEVRRSQPKLYELRCPLCDGVVTVQGDCDDCGVTGTKRVAEEGDDS